MHAGSGTVICWGACMQAAAEAARQRRRVQRAEQQRGRCHRPGGLVLFLRGRRRGAQQRRRGRRSRGRGGQRCGACGVASAGGRQWRGAWPGCAPFCCPAAARGKDPSCCSSACHERFCLASCLAQCSEPCMQQLRMVCTRVPDLPKAPASQAGRAVAAGCPPARHSMSCSPATPCSSGTGACTHADFACSIPPLLMHLVIAA